MRGRRDGDQARVLGHSGGADGDRVRRDPRPRRRACLPRRPGGQAGRDGAGREGSPVLRLRGRDRAHRAPCEVPARDPRRPRRGLLHDAGCAELGRHVGAGARGRRRRALARLRPCGSERARRAGLLPRDPVRGSARRERGRGAPRRVLLLRNRRRRRARRPHPRALPLRRAQQGGGPERRPHVERRDGSNGRRGRLPRRLHGACTSRRLEGGLPEGGHGRVRPRRRGSPRRARLRARPVLGRDNRAGLDPIPTRP